MSDKTPESEPEPDLNPCSNESCAIKDSCARRSDTEYYKSEMGAIAFPGPDSRFGRECPGFVVRKALGGLGNTDVVFSRAPGRRGRIHNPHAGVRESYPGSEALFGTIFRASNSRPPKRRMGFDGAGNPEGVKLPTKPDLMVKRHIVKGKDVNTKGDE